MASQTTATNSPSVPADCCKAMVPALLRTLCKEGTAWVFDDEAPSDAVVSKWHELMLRPIPKGIKYGKALQRILGHPATLYTVVEYKDVAIFLDEAFADVVRSPLDDWRALQAVNRLVACAVGHDIDRVPSREEIQANIQASKSAAAKKSADAAGSVTQACKMTYAGLGESLGDAASAAISERAAAADDHELTQEWGSMLRARPSFVDECVARTAPPAEAWTAVPAAARTALVAALSSSSSARAWSHVDQLNGFAKISSSIPTGVMGKIENMASKLAADLQSGSVTMETLNLQDIGEQVLSNCDASDLNKLTGNIGELLPVLSQMAPGGVLPGGVPGGVLGGVPGVPSMGAHGAGGK